MVGCFIVFTFFQFRCIIQVLIQPFICNCIRCCLILVSRYNCIIQLEICVGKRLPVQPIILRISKCIRAFTLCNFISVISTTFSSVLNSISKEIVVRGVLYIYNFSICIYFIIIICIFSFVYALSQLSLHDADFVSASTERTGETEISNDKPKIFNLPQPREMFLCFFISSCC